MKNTTTIETLAYGGTPAEIEAAAEKVVHQLRSEIGATLHDLILFKLITREVQPAQKLYETTLYEFCMELNDRNS